MARDAIIVGGGLAGSALAEQLAKAGRDVLVFERETEFKDRVRGENMLPWGVAAAKRLGIFDDLIAAGGNPANTWMTYAMGDPSPPRDLRATTPGGDTMLNMFHPDIQNVVTTRAINAGATIVRGTTVLSLTAGAGESPSVTYESEGRLLSESARIVVGADGRNSQMRIWGGFEVHRDPKFFTIAGTLIEGTDVPHDGAYLCMGPGFASFWAPLGQRKSRTYFVYPTVTGKRRLTGTERVADFLQAVQSVGTPASWTEGAQSIGPLAEFDGADRWVESPAKNGVVLIGDAAASSDPSWGSGLSLTLADIEHLAGQLTSNTDWNAAISDYARQHDQYYGALHRIHSWMRELIWTPGPEADARRHRVFSRMFQDPTGFPDGVGLGPFGPSDENARHLILGIGY
jgi:2-polyprenyl-6-methoxyphenol hydroxylase-like FAD-dependent oxidoreductase